jgi:protoporphyrinogen oxidase
MKKVVVVGAGVAGLCCASILADNGIPVVVLEKEPVVGGLARSFTYGDFTFDIGPHRFFTTHERVLSFIKDTLQGHYIVIPRRSGVNFLNQYHLWPLRLKSVFQLPPLVAVAAFLDIFTKNMGNHGEVTNFEEYVLRQYGKTLYNTFFKGYTEKFLGISGKDVHPDWAKIGVERATIDKKISTGSIFLILRTMLLPLPANTEFIYPRKGTYIFGEVLKQKIIDKGGEVITGAAPAELVNQDGNVTEVRIEGRSIPVEHLFWSGSLCELSDLLSLGDLELNYLSLLVYNIELAKPPQYQFQWCYFGAKDVIFSRITDPSLFSPDVIPSGRGGLCVEVTCTKGDDKWNDPERITAQVADDLVRTKMIERKEDILKAHPERIADAYPIYSTPYREKLEAAKKKVSVFKNITLFGRTGLFWYNNMDHSIENAFDITDTYLAQRKSTT